jgi:hypothetical protein
MYTLYFKNLKTKKVSFITFKTLNLLNKYKYGFNIK